MTNDLLKLLAQQDAYAKLLGVGDLASARVATVDLSLSRAAGRGGIMEMLEEEDRLRKMALGQIGDLAALGLASDQARRISQGPIEDARHLGLLASGAEHNGAIAAAMKAQTTYEALFRNPGITETGRLIAEVMKTQSASEIYLADQAKGIKAALDAMQAPWLKIDDPLRSTKGLTELLEIGHGVADRDPFGLEASSLLRAALGDWRDPVSDTLTTLLDPAARLELYERRGFDPALTDFTPRAFDEGLRVAGLGPWGREEADEANGDGELEDGGSEGELRAQRAYRELRRTEKAIRAFIVRVMTAAYGETWMKSQLPNGMYDAWVGKSEVARKAGAAEKPLIEFADFTDYRAIITKRDNWRVVFAPVFSRPEDVTESFQRLFPVRIATMHAGVITLDDELLLRVETRRIMSRIKPQT